MRPQKTLLIIFRVFVVTFFFARLNLQPKFPLGCDKKYVLCTSRVIIFHKPHKKINLYFLLPILQESPSSEGTSIAINDTHKPFYGAVSKSFHLK